MKKRMRYYVKQGWTVVVLEASLFDVKNYHSARAWCAKVFQDNTWIGRLTGESADSKFAFKNEGDATLFSLRWLKQ